MGMFDIIEDELFCPFCGTKQKKNSFQSKDTGDLGTYWTIKEIAKFFDKKEKIEIYTECLKCKKWISINLVVWRMTTQTHGVTK